jgi:hypothetical protein
MHGYFPQQVLAENVVEKNFFKMNVEQVVAEIMADYDSG